MRVFNTEPVPESPTWTQATIPLPVESEGSGPRRLLRKRLAVDDASL